MESSFSSNPLVVNILRQIKDALSQLEDWNNGILSPEDYAVSPDGMKTLAATSMLLEAIGEGVKKIDSRTKGTLFKLRPEIPWDDVKGIRDHIAHGYFDIDSDIIFDVVKNDLHPLSKAIDYLLQYINEKQ